MTTTTPQHRLASALIVTCLCFSVPAAVDAESSVEDRAKAAQAYDEGTAAYLAGRYELAAHWFERAYRLVPTSAALLQAARAHVKAEQPLRAGNLAWELMETYPADTRATNAARQILAPVARANLLVRVMCGAPCELEVDGAVVRHPSFFVTPEVEHELKAAFEHGEVSTSFRGPAGKTKKVALAAPPPEPAEAPPPIPKWAFFSSLGATAALGAVTIWSGIDANRGVSAYEAAAQNANSPGFNTGSSPTPAEQAQALLEEGQSKERRTNILIGVTAGMAATTAVLGVFTNWKGESRETASRRLAPSVSASREGGALRLEGRF